MTDLAEFLIGTRWRMNDSGTVFVVVDSTEEYCIVENERGPLRRRRVKAVRLKNTRGCTGYTEL